MKNILPFVVGAMLLFGLAYGSFQLEKWFNYKFSYQSKVEEQVKPLVERIDALEKRVSELEKK